MNNTGLVNFFHENTALNEITVQDLQNQIDYALNNEDFSRNCFEKDSIFKGGGSEFPLYNVSFDQDKLGKIICKRRTNSHLPQNKTQLDFKRFSKLLKYSFGITNRDYQNNLYAYPTEGGLNTIEIFVIVTKVKNIPKGAYLYNPYNNTLKLIKKGWSMKDYALVTGLLHQACNSFFSVYFVGNGKYSFQKYGDRSYRFMNIEAGHSSQNLYLVSTHLGLECAASGAFYDDNFLQLLNISDKSRYLLYENFVGL